MADKIRREVETRFTSKDEVSPTTKKMGGNLLALAKQFGPLAAAIGVAVGAALAFKKGLESTFDIIKKSVEGVADQSQKLQQLSDSLGISTQAMQGFGFAGEKVGVSSENLGLAIQRMTRRIGEAAAGGGEAKKKLEELGLPIQALAKMKPEEQFFRVAEALEGVEGQSAKLATAFKFFDSEGARPVLAILKQGTAALEEQFDRARELGGVYSDELVKKGLAFKAAQVEAKTALSSLGDEIADVFLPLATDAFSFLADFIAENRETIRRAAESMEEHLRAAFDGVRSFLEDHGEQFKAILLAWAKVAGTVTELTVRVFTQGAKDIEETVSWFDRLKASVGGLAGAAANLWAGPGINVDISRVPDEVRSGHFQEQLASLNEEIERLSRNLTEVPEIPAPATPPPIERPPVEGEPGFTPETGPTLPSVEQIDDVSSRFGSLQEAVEEFGVSAVANTLKVDAAIRQVGIQAKRTFVTEFGQAVQGMGRAISITLVKSWGDMKAWKESAASLWRSFTDEVIAMLIRLIAKLLIAAALQAILGFANFSAVAKLGQVLGLLKNPLGDTEGGGQSGGSVSDIRRRRRGRGAIGDAFLMPVEDGEFIMSRPAVNRIGRSALEAVNRGGGLTPFPGTDQAAVASSLGGTPGRSSGGGGGGETPETSGGTTPSTRGATPTDGGSLIGAPTGTEPFTPPPPPTEYRGLKVEGTIHGAPIVAFGADTKKGYKKLFGLAALPKEDDVRHAIEDLEAGFPTGPPPKRQDPISGPPETTFVPEPEATAPITAPPAAAPAASPFAGIGSTLASAARFATDATIEAGRDIVRAAASSLRDDTSIAAMNLRSRPTVPNVSPDSLIGAQTTIVIQNNVRTIWGSRDEGFEVARGVLEYAEELGYAVGGVS